MDITSDEGLTSENGITNDNTTIESTIGFVNFASPFDKDGSLYWVTVVSFIISVFLTIVGLLGNTFIIATVRSKRCQFSSHGVHLTALAIADIKSLLVALVNNRFVWNFTGSDIRGFTLTGCRLFLFSARVTKLCSIYFVVLVCVERFFGVWFPLKAKILTTKTTSVVTVILIFGVNYVISIASAFYGTLRFGKCIPDVIEGSPDGSRMLTSTALLLSTIIPAIAIVCFTSLTILKLFQQRTLRQQLHNSEIKDGTYRTTTMLVSISVVYLILVTSFAGTLWILMLNGINVFIVREPWAGIFVEVMVTCESLNCALNCVLYGFFSSRFRRDFVAVVKCGGRSNAVASST